MIYIKNNKISYKFDLSSKKKKYEKFLNDVSFISSIDEIKIDYENNVYVTKIPFGVQEIKIGRIARISAKLGQRASVPKVVGESVSFETKKEKIKIDVYSNTHNIKTEKNKCL